MANNYTTQKVHSHVLEVTTPGVDYGLKNDDGYDPSKYEFYNPSNRSATTSFVVRLDEYAPFPTSRLVCRIKSAH